ncbi:MAG: hypothetical protein KBS60_07565 [Phascolarctobacterium sp.]|nr:hypothetical protein [Candidatus Phascolarctobacterium caballi]
MAKKFSSEDVFNKFQTMQGDETPQEEKTTPSFYVRPVDEEKKKPGRPRKNPVKRNYHFNLNLDEDLKDFLAFIAWKNKCSITEYINTCMRLERESYLKECEEKGIKPFEGWIDEE